VDTTARDLFTLIVLTGMRKLKALELQWDDIDLSSGVITLRDTKNGDDRIFPISNYALMMMVARRARARPEARYIYFQIILLTRLRILIVCLQRKRWLSSNPA